MYIVRSTDMTASDRALVIFARAPVAGTVKTRLAAALGVHEALRIHRELGSITLRQARQVRDCRLVVAYTPAERRKEMLEWLGGDLELLPQPDGDLGERMLASFEHCASRGAARIAIVGTDCPALDAALIERAFLALDSAEVVFGPALDGGYYLIALRRPVPGLLRDVPWSSPRTLPESLLRAKHLGLSVGLLPPLGDIDTPEDWRRWTSAHPAASSPTSGG